MKTRSTFIALFLVIGIISLHADTISVTSVNDSGPGSLRAALASAANGDTVNFSLTMPGTITLTSGELLVTNSVTIAGPGPGNLAVDGNATNRVFHIGSNTVVCISSLTISNGNANGATFLANHGGGIWNDQAALTVSNCTLNHNTARGYGGGIYNRSSLNGTATLEVVNSTLSSNGPVLAGGGISNDANTNGSASVKVVNSLLTGNYGGIAGGGIHSDVETNGNASINIVNSTLSGNFGVGTEGGGINIGYWGGGITTVEIVNSTLSGNSASYGGGINIISGGSSGRATVEIVNSTLSGNSANFGGGICMANGGFASGATLEIVNSTLSGNSAGDDGGGISIDYGGFGSGGTLEIGSTILNAGTQGANISPGPGRVISLGYNLSNDGGGGFLTATGDQINTDPMLGPLQDNGGPTFTHALRVGSPAIDQGKNFSGSATDQRGSPRRFDDPNIANAIGGDGSDIGAYEAAQLQMTAAVKAGNDFQLSFTSLLGTNYEVQSRSDMVAGAWTSLQSGIPGNGGIAVATVTNAFTQSQQFYRVHAVP